MRSPPHSVRGGSIARADFAGTSAGLLDTGAAPGAVFGAAGSESRPTRHRRSTFRPMSSNPSSSFRGETGRARGRAHSAEDKARVRQAFIDVGQRLIAEEGADNVSLRRIAAAAGYSPGTIYQYFQDQRELLFAIREFDMDAATDLMESAAAGEKDPALRLRKLFMGSVNYWLSHLDHFDLLFSGPMGPHPTSGRPFGQSATVARSLALYRKAVDDFLRSLPKRPLPTNLATDILIATSHGVIAFPRLTSTMQWSDMGRMAEQAIDALIQTWALSGGKPIKQR